MTPTPNNDDLVQKLDQPTSAELASFLDFDNIDELMESRDPDGRIYTCAGYWFETGTDDKWDFYDTEDDDA